MATISLTKIKRSIYSIRWRILIAYLLIISVAFSVVAASLIQLVGDYMFNQRIKDDQRITESLSEQMRERLYALDVPAMYGYASDVSLENESRVLVLDNYGVVQVDTDSSLNGHRLKNSEVASVLSGAESDYGFYDLSGGTFRRASLNVFTSVDAMTGLYTSPITLGGRLIGVLAYISHTQEIFESLHEIQRNILLWLVLVAVAALIMSMFVVRTITRPIGELSTGITRMSKGDLTSRVDVRGKTEFAELARAFNSMSERIEKLDKSRNLFVSNASHELKTPLSTMKILIETLLYQNDFDPVVEKEFLGDVNKEIDRLNRIVSDLLTLVNIDSGGMQLNLTEIKLRELTLEQVKRLAPLARERGIELLTSAKEPCEIMGDALKLQQVIYNVIDNAIKYTARGGSVRVSVSKSGKRALVRISDTGIGIPEDDLPHIFDRFYRVDRARSRETGGTGLGLSIVKQIVLLHEGDIRAESQEGYGSEFVIDLPLYSKRIVEAK